MRQAGDVPFAAERAVQAPDAAMMPRGVKWGLAAAVGTLVMGAGYLAVVRGPAILIDLAGAVRTMLCL